MQTLMEAKQAAGEEIRDAETLEQPEYAALRARVHACSGKATSPSIKILP